MDVLGSQIFKKLTVTVQYIFTLISSPMLMGKILKILLF